MALDGFAELFAREMKCHLDEVRCFITGKDAKYVMGSCKRSFSYDENLTLIGLYRLFVNTRQNLKSDNNR